MIGWYEKQAEPGRSGRGIGRARQHHVGNARGQVMVAEADPDLFPGDAPGAVALRHGQGPQAGTSDPASASEMQMVAAHSPATRRGAHSARKAGSA
jgi:hypothetical protein